MIQINRKIKAISLIALVLLVFSSCSKSKWRASVLDFGTDVHVVRGGDFWKEIGVSALHIDGFSPSHGDKLIDIRVLDSWVKLSNLRREDRIKLKLELIDRGGRFIAGYGPVEINGGNRDGEATISDGGLHRFMQDLAVGIIRDREVYVRILGGSHNVEPGAAIGIDFSNNIDIRVNK